MIWADVWRGSYLDRSVALYEWQTLQRLRKQLVSSMGLPQRCTPAHGRIRTLCLGRRSRLRNHLEFTTSVRAIS